MRAPLTELWLRPRECPNSWAATANKDVPGNKVDLELLKKLKPRVHDRGLRAALELRYQNWPLAHTNCNHTVLKK